MSPENDPVENTPTAVVKSEDFRAYYANFVQAVYTPFDISLLIGEAGGYDPANKRWVVEQKARVTMAAAEAKVVVLILANAVKNFEKQFGAIKMPSDVVEAQGGEIDVNKEGV